MTAVSVSAVKKETAPSAAMDAAGAASTVSYRELPFHDPARRLSDRQHHDRDAPLLLVDAWADTIAGYWQTGLAAGIIDPAHPLYLLDPDAGSGRLAWLLLSALQSRLQAIQARPTNAATALQPRYIACCANEAATSDMLEHGYLKVFRDAGWIDSAAWRTADAGTHAALRLHDGGVMLSGSANPIVVVALGWLQTLPSDLYAVHHGGLLQGRARVTKIPLPDGAGDPQEYRFDYEWQPLTGEGLAPETAALLAAYRARYSSNALTLPVTACETLDTIAALSDGRYLLLAADPGCCSEQQLRLGALTPPDTWRCGGILGDEGGIGYGNTGDRDDSGGNGGNRDHADHADNRCGRRPQHPPVNYHAVSAHQQRRGALVWNRQRQPGGLVMHVAWRHDDEPSSAAAEAAAHAFSTFFDTLPDTHPDDSRQMAAMQRATAARPGAAAGAGMAGMANAIATVDVAPAAACLALLRASHYDPQVLQAALPGLLEHCLTVDDSLRRDWQAALERVWRNWFPLAASSQSAAHQIFYSNFGCLAMQLGHWGLARDSLRLGLYLFGEYVADLYLLAQCEAATGGVAAALPLVEQALALAPDDTFCIALRDDLRRRLQRWQAVAWYHAATAEDAGAERDGHDSRPPPLTLEPLGVEHASDLLYQYRDRQIGEMTRLPDWRSEDEVRTWIEDQAGDGSHATYAIQHGCWGFVGVVSMQYDNDAAYFYFWIGSDFQNCGYGRRAAALLFDQMARFGVAHIFTSVYRDNLRSINALRHLGFAPIDLAARAPDEDLIFCYRPQHGVPPLTGTSCEARIRLLCDAVESEFDFIGPTGRCGWNGLESGSGDGGMP